MPTFTAIALDRLLEPGASKSVHNPMPNSRPIPNPKPVPNSKTVSNSKLERRNSSPTVERKVHPPQILPALYATPKATPLPDSPTSFSPSPYIINHKRRGPRLLKSYSEDDVSSRQKSLDGEVDGNTKNAVTKVAESTENVSVTFTIPNHIGEEHIKGVHAQELGSGNGEPGSSSEEPGSSVVEFGSSKLNNGLAGENGSSNMSNSLVVESGSGNLSNGLAGENDSLKFVSLNSEREGDGEKFFDLQESMSFTSNTDGEDTSVTERALKLTTPMGEFFDAWEELSSEEGPQPSLRDVEAELREMRLSVLMEIQKRKQAEEALNNMRSQWQRIRQQLAAVGLTLPADLTAVEEDEQLDFDPAEELCRQFYLARFVSESIGRGTAKAEVEMEMEAQIELKNFEIARLWDRLHFYEAMNREMSQRNQEAVEMARRDRQRRKRRQKWVWGSIASAITLGTAALAWSYLPAGKGLSSTYQSQDPGCDDAAAK